MSSAAASASRLQSASLMTKAASLMTKAKAASLEKMAGAAVVHRKSAAKPVSFGLSSSFTPCLRYQAAPCSLVGPRAMVVRAVAQVEEEIAYIEFVRGLKEQAVPEVRLTRSPDGSTGTATFRFDSPSVFDQSTEIGEITGLYLVDEEGVIQSVEVNAMFVNGRPQSIEARHIMRSEREWDRFMRFMERYASTHGLGFNKA